MTAAELARVMPDVARHFWGAPNPHHSNGTELRWGANGARTVDVAKGVWFDHEANEGGGVVDLLKREGVHDAWEWLRAKGFAQHRDNGAGGKRELVAVYNYTDEQKNLLFQVMRLDPKTFRQRRLARPDDSPDKVKNGWVWSVKGVRQVPFRLPELIEALTLEHRLFVVEGEKDVLTLARHGITATCNAGGAGKWRADFADHLVGADVVVLPDNDAPGRAHALEVAHSLVGKAARIRIVNLPDLPDKGDVSDWFAAGGTLEAFNALIEAAADWKAEAEPDRTGSERKARESTSGGQAKPNGAWPPAGTLLLDPKDPMPAARRLRAERYDLNGLPLLHHHRGGFYHWRQSCYRTTDADALRTAAWEFLEQAERPSANGAVPYQPNGARVTDLLDALAAVSHMAADAEAPCWLGKDAPPLPFAPDELLPVGNGLLHLPGGELYAATPRLFCLNATDVSFDPRAPAPRQWRKFLKQLWGQDRASIETLSEWFGYCLTPDTRQQKILVIVGPSRSGKGTIAKVLARLVGSDNVVAPTLASLGSNFGLQPLIGKSLAIISDARLGGRADQAAIIERLLAISGEDPVTIDRKHMPAWTGRLPTRFVILTNELPRLTDASGALSSRMNMLLLTQSFFGREDHGLAHRLFGELPAILNMARQGLLRLRKRGHFVQPESAREAIGELEALGSPVGAFIRERCNVGPACEIEVEALFNGWLDWCKANGRKKHGTIQTFGRDLRAKLPGLKTVRSRAGDDRNRKYVGIDLKQ